MFSLKQNNEASAMQDAHDKEIYDRGYNAGLKSAAEIAALVEVLAFCYQFDDCKRFSETIIKLRQLLAVKNG